MTNEEIQEKADELSIKNSCKVHPLVFMIEGSEEKIIGFLKEPPRHVKTRIMDKAMISPITSCADIMTSYIIKEESDARIYDEKSENDQYFHGAVMAVYDLIQIAVNHFKKK